MISLIPAFARRRTQVEMVQSTSQAVQQCIEELLKRTKEKEEERKKRKRESQTSEVTERQHGRDQDQMTTLLTEQPKQLWDKEQLRILELTKGKKPHNWTSQL